MADQASFARDLGYLDKFLVALRAHGQGLNAPERAELLGLLDEEVARWGRIKAILGSANSAAASTTSASAPATASAQFQAAKSGWTVGSLMPRP